jgi:hypothetical protein
MTRAHLTALGLAVAGVVISVSSGALSAASPDLRDAVHAFGLVVMLAAAFVFLTVRRLAGASESVRRRVHASRGAEETAGNLAIAGAVFLAGAMALGIAFRWVLRPDMLVYWILLGLGLLGAVAMVAGAAGFILIKMIGPPAASRQENGP